MASQGKGKPQGYHTITPQLTVKDAEKAIEFYKKAFGAKELERFSGPGGKLVHVELEIGDSRLFLSDEFPDWGCFSPQTVGKVTGSLYVYVDDVDAVFNKAVQAGATVKMPLSNMFWGDRLGKLADPFGHEWGLASHVEDVSPEETKKRGEAFFAQAAQAKP